MNVNAMAHAHAMESQSMTFGRPLAGLGSWHCIASLPLPTANGQRPMDKRQIANGIN